MHLYQLTALHDQFVKKKKDHQKLGYNETMIVNQVHHLSKVFC